MLPCHAPAQRHKAYVLLTLIWVKLTAASIRPLLATDTDGLQLILSTLLQALRRKVRDVQRCKRWLWSQWSLDWTAGCSLASSLAAMSIRSKQTCYEQMLQFTYDPAMRLHFEHRPVHIGQKGAVPNATVYS